MKKRSMLAVASLAAGVVASLVAPSAHAGAPDREARGSGVLNSAGLVSLDQAVSDAQDTVTEARFPAAD